MSVPCIRPPGPLNSMGAKGPPSVITGISLACVGMKPLTKNAKSEITTIAALFFIATPQLQYLS